MSSISRSQYFAMLSQVTSHGTLTLPDEIADSVRADILAPIAYRYGNSREDIYCLPCALRRNNLAAATAISYDELIELGELECAFCEAVI